LFIFRIAYNKLLNHPYLKGTQNNNPLFENKKKPVLQQIFEIVFGSKKVSFSLLPLKGTDHSGKTLLFYVVAPKIDLV